MGIGHLCPVFHENVPCIVFKLSEMKVTMYTSCCVLHVLFDYWKLWEIFYNLNWIRIILIYNLINSRSVWFSINWKELLKVWSLLVILPPHSLTWWHLLTLLAPFENLQSILLVRFTVNPFKFEHGCQNFSQNELFIP